MWIIVKTWTDDSGSINSYYGPWPYYPDAVAAMVRMGNKDMTVEHMVIPVWQD